jgi:hypothetical protein
MPASDEWGSAADYHRGCRFGKPPGGLKIRA